MKKIVILSVLLIAGVAKADTASDLIGLGMPAEQASALKSLSVTSVTATNGDIVASTSGKTLRLQEATAAAKCMGTLTCNGASDVVTSTTCAETSSRIFLTRTSLDADTTGDAYVKAISNGVSFTVACELNDTGTLNWIIFNEAS